MSPLRVRQALLVGVTAAVLLVLGVVVNGVAGAVSALLVAVVVASFVAWRARRRSARGG